MADTPQKPSVSADRFPLDNLRAQMQAEAKAEQATMLSEAEVNSHCDTLHEWAAQIPNDKTAIRVRANPERAVLEVVGPDRPFLVDSLLGACVEQGLEIKTLFHPILKLEADTRRSLIQIHLPPLSEPAQDRLIDEVRATLADVKLATDDYQAMRARMASEAERLAASRHVADDQKAEALAFLNWLGSENFIFLGVREYTFNTGPDGNVLPEEPDMVEGSNLGLLRHEDRNVLNRGAEPLVINAAISEFLSEPEPLILAKATLSSRVHRRVVCDYVGVKHFGSDGRVNGETRFLGLYTAEAYNDSVRNIPLVRKRAQRVIEASGAIKGTHNEKALRNILEGWPRDELIQTKSEELTPIMLGALQLIGRPRVRLFVRRDRFDRFVSAIVFVPREAYDTHLRAKIAETLERAFEGKLTSFQPSFDATTMVRVLFEIALPAGKRVTPDLNALEADLATLARTWNDRFRTATMAQRLTPDASARASLFTGAFNAAYREAFTPDEAMIDVEALSKLSAATPIALRAFRRDSDPPEKIRAKIYSRSGAISLSDCVPVFERMGLFVAFETGYPVRPNEKPVPDAPETYWIHDLSMHIGDGSAVSLTARASDFEAAFVAIWSGLAENDGFNALVFKADLTWREAALCRALCAYRHQTGLDPARETQIEALKHNADLTRHLVTYFKTRFDPALNDEDRSRASTMRSDIDAALQSVKSLDHDRVIRRLADLIAAIQRTNFFQTTPAGTARPVISFKIASRELVDLPAPKPYREIFLSGPKVDGVHCRFGAVARGGLRWSDRRDDFRTEVLGLVKAQQVKNAVIVPVGSKGGFFPKQLPQGGTRQDWLDAGIDAYKTFITGLLDLTDNLIDGKVQRPEKTVIYDGEDPYLVVAADKGTATFSDIANEISESHGFWLGDAFASGGSAGYDHKKMGITARGGWEAVKRHFREMGKDIQAEPFTVIGCGDMSGDVFGNGMLLSRQIRLQAAFNHMHIFVDPDPQDLERCWQERERLFNLPRSSWADYDQSLISAGGGLFERSAKSIPLTPQIKALTGLSAAAVTPDELIHALLMADCELLWFGGIGTYIKSSSESHMQAGDRANDGLRINGKQVRAKVIGEGANLGLTQAGRIEAAQSGVRLNTDAIDNSAGVDSSDHEVNIKILCTEAMRRGDLPRGERNHLLASMTDDVAAHVLAHNYAQTAALSLAEHTAKSDHDAYERLMVYLESRGVLDRVVEGLPSTAEMAERQLQNRPLTRPEMAVLMAWTKIILFDDLVASTVPDDPHFETTLQSYFPQALRQYDDAMQAHRLKREIIATVLANHLIDVCGPVFLLRLREQSGAGHAAITLAFEAALTLLDARTLQADIHALDNHTPAQAQIQLLQTLAHSLAALTQKLALSEQGHSMAQILARHRDPLQALRDSLPDSLNKFGASRFRKLLKRLSHPGVPEELAAQVAQSETLALTPTLTSITGSTRLNPSVVFAGYQEIGDALGLDRLCDRAEAAVDRMPYWDRLATRRLIRELEHLQSEASKLALGSGNVSGWLADKTAECQALTADIRTFTSNNPSFAQFALAGDSVRNFMQSHAV